MIDKEETSFINSLLHLPLLNGASRPVIEQFVGRNRLVFSKYQAGETIFHPATPCTHVNFLLNGTVRLVSAAAGGDITVEQTLEAPQVIGAEYLFGLSTLLPYGVEALGACGMLQLPKDDYRALLNSDNVFQINYLNMLCSMVQRGRLILASASAASAPVRLILWVQSLTQPGARQISVKCNADGPELHSLMGISASAWRQTMEKMLAQGLLTEASPHCITFDGNQLRRI